jgi:hypothetical protein
MPIEAGRHFQCLNENCKCEVTINQLPTNFGSLASFGFGEKLEEDQKVKCNFCGGDMQQVKS